MATNGGGIPHGHDPQPGGTLGSLAAAYGALRGAALAGLRPNVAARTLYEPRPPGFRLTRSSATGLVERDWPSLALGMRYIGAGRVSMR